MVLGKAEGTLLTGASLSRKTEAADGLALGCLAPANKIPQASEPLAEERNTEGPSGRRTQHQSVLGHLNASMTKRSWTRAELRGVTRMEGFPELDLEGGSDTRLGLGSRGLLAKAIPITSSPSSIGSQKCKK